MEKQIEQNNKKCYLYQMKSILTMIFFNKTKSINDIMWAEIGNITIYFSICIYCNIQQKGVFLDVFV